MRAFAWFMGLLAAALLAIAVLAYPAWLAIGVPFDIPFHRVANRIAMLAALIGFILVARHLGLADRASLGYALPARAFARECAIGLALGVATMLPVALVLFALGLRTLDAAEPLTLAALGGVIAAMLVRGLAVAFIEETFLRGAMYTGIARQSGPTLAIALTALLYAATHFLGRHRIPAAEVDAGSGLELLGGALAAFAQPLAIADAFLCLAAVGVLLGIVRRLTGNIAACVGLHAGWVLVIGTVREISTRDRGHALDPLVSDYDGVVGWLVLAAIPLIGWLLVRFYARRSIATSTDQRRDALES
jgi:hypothetical protein